MALDLRKMFGDIVKNMNVSNLGLPKADEALVNSLLTKIRKKQSLTANEKAKALDLLSKISGKLSSGHKKIITGLLDKVAVQEKNQTIVKKIKKSL